MNAPPFPLNPSVGEWFQNWVWNGSRWVCSRSAGVRVITTAFLANAPYQPSPGLVTAVVTGIGGGGGGGAAGPSSSANYIIGGGGGGSGGWSQVTLAAALVLGGVNVTIGAAGAGGLISPAAQAGSPGGATSFGGFLLANGGLGGLPAVPGVSSPLGGAGGPIGTGDVCFPGADGQMGPMLSFPTGLAAEWAGSWGGQIISGAHAAVSGPGGGANAPAATANTGAGGGGALFVEEATGAIYVGGAGGSGILWVTEFCWADAADSGEDCCDPRTVNVNARVQFDRGHSWGDGKPSGGQGQEAFEPYGWGDDQ